MSTAQQIYDAAATKQNYDTTHTSRPDAVPMWDDLDPLEQVELTNSMIADGLIDPDDGIKR